MYELAKFDMKNIVEKCTGKLKGSDRDKGLYKGYLINVKAWNDDVYVFEKSSVRNHNEKNIFWYMPVWVSLNWIKI